MSTLPNDSVAQAFQRAESFLKAARAKLEQWLHIPEVQAAHTDLTNALDHTAEGQLMAAALDTAAAASAVAAGVATGVQQVAENTAATLAPAATDTGSTGTATTESGEGQAPAQ
jgi:hypothetical protein